MTLTVLKLIAFLCMLIDHLGFVFSSYSWGILSNTLWMRQIGRLAFPIYTFCCVYGCTHTSNKPRYLKRLAIEAIISAVPYTIAFADKPVLFQITGQTMQNAALYPAFSLTWIDPAPKVILGTGLCASVVVLTAWKKLTTLQKTRPSAAARPSSSVSFHGSYQEDSSSSNPLSTNPLSKKWEPSLPVSSQFEADEQTAVQIITLQEALERFGVEEPNENEEPLNIQSSIQSPIQPGLNPAGISLQGETQHTASAITQDGAQHLASPMTHGLLPGPIQEKTGSQTNVVSFASQLQSPDGPMTSSVSPLESPASQLKSPAGPQVSSASSLESTSSQLHLTAGPLHSPSSQLESPEKWNRQVSCWKETLLAAVLIFSASAAACMSIQMGPIIVLDPDENVIYTFLIGAIALCILESIFSIEDFCFSRLIVQICGSACFTLLLFFTAERCDYGGSWNGLFLMACFYLVMLPFRFFYQRKKRKAGSSSPHRSSARKRRTPKMNWLFNLLCALCVLLWVLYCIQHQILNENYWPYMAGAALILVFFHPAKKPYPNALRLLFYSFYPLHLAILGAINVFLILKS